MTTTELEVVEALLDRLLPDPRGFAERLVQQLIMTRWAGASPDGDPVVVPGPGTRSGSPPVDSNVLLAAALGACDCWGLSTDCRVCGGAGSSGWTQPDAALFADYVAPALARLSPTAADLETEDYSANRHEDPIRGPNHDQTVQGGNR